MLFLYENVCFNVPCLGTAYCFTLQKKLFCDKTLIYRHLQNLFFYDKIVVTKTGGT